MAGIETSISSPPEDPVVIPPHSEGVQALSEEPPAPPIEGPDTQPPTESNAAPQAVEPPQDEEEYTEYDAYGCHCNECLNYDSQQDDRYDDGGGLDWNESGYFD